MKSQAKVRHRCLCCAFRRGAQKKKKQHRLAVMCRVAAALPHPLASCVLLEVEGGGGEGSGGCTAAASLVAAQAHPQRALPRI